MGSLLPLVVLHCSGVGRERTGDSCLLSMVPPPDRKVVVR